MEKDELRTLIQNTKDLKILEALWELYELKFMAKKKDDIIVNTRDFKRDGDSWILTTTTNDPYNPNSNSHAYLQKYMNINDTINPNLTTEG